MGYSPWGCKESDMTEQLSLKTPGVPAGQSRVLLALLCTASSLTKQSAVNVTTPNLGLFKVCPPV